MSSSKIQCIACNTPMVLLYEKMFDDRYGCPGFFDVYRCPSCKQAQTMPLLHDDELPDLYGNYYPRSEIDIEALKRQVGRPSDPLEIKKRYLNGTDNQGQYVAGPNMRVLDYGCGAGLSLLEIEALGADAYGIEADPNVQQVIDQLGLRIHIGSLDDAPFDGIFFDLIVLNQVLEHIPEPEILLDKLRSRLKPGGRLLLSFPNAGSIYARYFKRMWINWHIPYHQHLFNPRSAHLFFERCGWKIVSLRTITPNLWTILQFRALIETTKMGIPNPMWTGKPSSIGGPDVTSVQPSWLHRRLRRLALSASNPVASSVLTLLNRTVDRLGYGDSLLIELRPN